MRQIILMISFGWAAMANGQYRFDNKLFKTIYPVELCVSLEKATDGLILDVRSRGEYGDSSSSAGLNIGHIRNAVNIDVRELAQRLDEIRNYKAKPVFVYCSHSQRSRRASKLLADSGFTYVVNLNGGLTAVYYESAVTQECRKQIIVDRLPYQVINASQLCRLQSAAASSLYLLDVRPDSAWERATTNEKMNAYGRLRGATHMSVSTLEKNFRQIPKQSEIVIFDLFGDESAKAASFLSSKGFADVSVLVEGLDRFMSEMGEDNPCGWSMYESVVPYHQMSALTLQSQLEQSKLLLLDVRTKKEFNNEHEQSFRNVGRLRGAENVPLEAMDEILNTLTQDKTQPIVVYSFGGNPEAYAAARKLTNAGCKNVSVLLGGLFSIRWQAANMKGRESLLNMVENIPPDNL